MLSLLVPVLIYNFALKASSIIAYGGGTENVELGLGLLGYLMWSETTFSLGYALLWTGLFAATRSRGSLRWAVVVLFHILTIFLVLASTCAFQYFKVTGTTLNYSVIALWLPQLDEVMPMAAPTVPLLTWMLLFAVLLYVILGPSVITRVFEGWRGWSSISPPRALRIYSLVPLVVCSMVFGGALLYSSLPGFSGSINVWEPENAWRFSRSLVTNSFVNVLVTASQELGRKEVSGVAADQAPKNSDPASLQPNAETEQRNVAVIILESTRAQSVTPYNEDLATTPFLNTLANSSLLAERAYTVVPWTSKANVAINCGIYPQLNDPTYGGLSEAEPGSLPARCLPDLLKEQGYNAAYFQPVTKNFENRQGLVKNFGYEEFYPLESLDEEDKKGFDSVIGTDGGFALEDDVMLKPSKEWLEKQKESDKPFLATYLTATAHYGYIVPKRYGEETFSEDEEFNRYLNTVRYQDFFLKNIFDQYKELGLYEDTVFLIVGDHGEGFGEKGARMHGLALYEQVARIPMLIHDPRQSENGGVRLEEPVNQADILPTVADLLGYEINGGAYPGSSLLRPLPKNRTLMLSCLLEKCAASVKGSEKYIYYFGDKPDEIFDLSEDPLEKNNLADERGKDAVEERRDDLLAQRSKIDALYRGPQK